MTTPTLYAQKNCCEATAWHIRISMLHVIEFLVSERQTPTSYFHSRRKKDTYYLQRDIKQDDSANAPLAVFYFFFKVEELI